MPVSCRANWVCTEPLSTAGSASWGCADTEVADQEPDWRDHRIEELEGKIARLERVIGGQSLDLNFFESALRRVEETARKSGELEESIYAEIRSWMRAQGGLSIQHLCELAGVSRASFYRSWEQCEPSVAETELRDHVQRLAVMHRYYGYRRITVLLQREGWAWEPRRCVA